MMDLYFAGYSLKSMVLDDALFAAFMFDRGVRPQDANELKMVFIAILSGHVFQNHPDAFDMMH